MRDSVLDKQEREKTCIRDMDLLYKLIFKYMFYMGIHLYVSQKILPENFSDLPLPSDYRSSISMPQCSGFDLNF